MGLGYFPFSVVGVVVLAPGPSSHAAPNACAVLDLYVLLPRSGGFIGCVIGGNVTYIGTYDSQL